MKPKEIIIKAFEGGKPERVPVTFFRGRMWSIHNFETTFYIGKAKMRYRICRP